MSHCYVFKFLVVKLQYNYEHHDGFLRGKIISRQYLEKLFSFCSSFFHWKLLKCTVDADLHHHRHFAPNKKVFCAQKDLKKGVVRFSHKKKDFSAENKEKERDFPILRFWVCYKLLKKQKFQVKAISVI